MTTIAQYRGDIIIQTCLSRKGILELDIVSGSGVGHGTPNFDALSERSNYWRHSQSTVAGPPSCASVALRRRLTMYRQRCPRQLPAMQPHVVNGGKSLW